MSERVRWSLVAIALGALAAVAIATPAIGGQSATSAVKTKSLKKLVKKEVAKQIAKATGPAGSQGPKGDPGAPGATNVVTRSAQEAVADGALGQQVAECLPGEVAIGGGVGFNNPNNDFVVMLTEPLEADDSLPEAGDVPTQWLGRARNDSGGMWTMTVYVSCASP